MKESEVVYTRDFLGIFQGVNTGSETLSGNKAYVYEYENE